MAVFSKLFPPINQWNWEQLTNPNTFTWTVDKTPLSGYKSILWLWITYFSLIGIIKLIMKNKKPFNVNFFTSLNNKVFIAWSILLTFLSGLSIFDKLSDLKLKELYCEYESTTKGLWPYITYLYYLNKIYQLTGSISLALKKKPLKHYHIWRHVYAIPLTYSWLNNRMTYSTLAVFVNSFVHTFLYIYSWRISVDMKKAPFYKKQIVFLQSFQFIASFAICVPHLFFYVISHYPSLAWNDSYNHENIKCEGMYPFFLTLIGNIFFFVGFIRIHLKDLKILNNKFYFAYISYLNEIAPDKLSKQQRKILEKKINPMLSLNQKRGIKNKKKAPINRISKSNQSIKKNTDQY